MSENLKDKKKRLSLIFKKLKKAHPDAGCALLFETPWQLLVATILSAQCTDKRVNQVVSSLFKKYKMPNDYVKADPEIFAKEIHSVGFYKTKTRNILKTAKIIAKRYKNRVPREMEELIKLPGVGRKTANVLLGNAFDIPSIAVDTHMIRINKRLNFTRNTDPTKIEYDLMQIIPPKQWIDYSHLIIYHGRNRCFARNPDCRHCEIKAMCFYF